MMEHKVYMNYIHPSSLLRQLSDLWQADQMCDAVLTVDKIIVAKAHKVVLLAVSPRLKSDSSNSSQCPILDVCLPSGLSHRSVHAFLQYIYEGYLILTKKLAKDLLKISDFLKIKCLSNCCSDFLDSLEDDVVLVSDDKPLEVKTEEFCHVRKSKNEEFAKEQKERDEEETGSTVAKKRKINTDSPRQSDQSPIPPSPSHSISHQNSEAVCKSSDSSSSRSGDNSADRRRSQFIVQDAQSGETVMGKEDGSWDKSRLGERSNIQVKREQSGSCAVSQDNNEWNIDTARSTAGGGDPLSSVAQGGLSLEAIKTEPEGEIDQNFFQSITSASDGEQGDYDGQTMWFSGDSVQHAGPSQGMAASNVAHGSFQQRSMTPFSSLTQMRAQQSIKRSIQSSVSAARRARSMGGISESVSSPGDQGDQSFSSDGREDLSNENPYVHRCQFCGQEYNRKGSLVLHIHRNHKAHRFQCPACQKTFPFKWDLKHHVMTTGCNTASTQYNCQFCHKPFTDMSAFTSHMETCDKYPSRVGAPRYYNIPPR